MKDQININNNKITNYLSNLNSPYIAEELVSIIKKKTEFKVANRPAKTQTTYSLKRIEDPKKLALRSKPILNNKNAKASLGNLINSLPSESTSLFTTSKEVLTTSPLKSIAENQKTQEKIEDIRLQGKTNKIYYSEEKESLFDAMFKNSGKIFNEKLRDIEKKNYQNSKNNTNKGAQTGYATQAGSWTTDLSSNLNKGKNGLLLYVNKRHGNIKHPRLMNYSNEASSLLKSFHNFDVLIANSKNIVYNFNNSKKKLLKNLESILHSAFYSMRAIISRPVLEITGKKIIIHLFFFFKSFLRRNRRRNKRFFSSINNKFKNFKKRNRQRKYYKFNKQFFKRINYKYFAFSGRNRYYKNFLNRNRRFLGLLAKTLSKYLHQVVEFQLTKLHYPINESFILAKSIGILGNKIRRRFKFFVNASFKSAKIDNPNNFNLKRNMKKSIRHNASSSITGIRMKLGGRILAQKIVPRFTSQTFQEGSLSRGITNLVSTSRFTSKNKKGSYSISVSMGHRFF